MGVNMGILIWEVLSRWRRERTAVGQATLRWRREGQGLPDCSAIEAAAATFSAGTAAPIQHRVK